MLLMAACVALNWHRVISNNFLPRQAPVTMNSFLQRTKLLTTGKVSSISHLKRKSFSKFHAPQDPLIIVLGNESCDLDSIISALSLAYFYSMAPSAAPYQANNTQLIVPMINKPRAILPTTTEFTFFAHQHNIDLANIICR